MFGLVTLLLGLFLSYLLISGVYKEMTLPKILCSILAFYFSFMILVSFYIDLAGAPLSMRTFFIAFLISIALYTIISKRQSAFIKVEPKSIFAFLVIVVGGFLFFVYPSIPSFLPLGAVEDPARHFALAQYIQETNSLVHGAVIEWGGGTPVSTYPFGMHLNVAFLSTVLNKPLIKFIFPFSAFIVTLSAAAVYGISRDLIEDEIAALFSGVFFLTSIIIHQNLSLLGAYPILFGGFLALMFTWILMDYSNDSDLPKLGILIVLECAIILTYPFWALIALGTYIITLYHAESMLKQERILHGASFIAFSGLLTIIFWIDKFRIVKARLSEPGPVLDNPLMLTGLIVFSLAIIGIFSYDKKHLVWYSVLAAIIILSLGIFAYSTWAPISQYWYYKTYYFLEYPMIVFASIGLGRLTRYFRRVYLNLDKRRGLLLALLLVGMLGYVFYLKVDKVEKMRFRSLSVTPEEYEFAMWIRENIPLNEKLSFVNFNAVEDQITGNWIVAISRHAWDTSETIVITKDIYKIPEDKAEEYELLHQKGKLAVLRRKEF
jgi:hypothetical protein